jgi:RNA polymerase sigma-70 factor (ECF subfamily)
MLSVGRMVADTTSAPSTAAEAFDARFESARPRLLAIAHSLLGADDAEDIVQDTYLRAKSRAAQLRDPSLVDAWLARIAVNLCFNRHRRRRIALAWLSGRHARQGPTEGRDAGLRELIERLAPRERTVVVLHYGHGYATEEIATMLTLSPTNVRTILFRARARLRAAVQEANR